VRKHLFYKDKISQQLAQTVVAKVGVPWGMTLTDQRVDQRRLHAWSHDIDEGANRFRLDDHIPSTLLNVYLGACITHRDRISRSCTFLQFADVTMDSVKELFGPEDARVIRDA
jgi:hypothetical protein